MKTAKEFVEKLQNDEAFAKQVNDAIQAKKDAGAKDYPELGFVSGMRGGIMTVYTHVQPGAEQGPLSERS